MASLASQAAMRFNAKPTAGSIFAALTVMLAVAAFFTPRTPFSADEVVYIDMARAMSERGALDITEQNRPAGAPVMPKSESIVQVIDDRVMPQYPSGYAVIAAPFYTLFDVSGLILMNALAAAAALWLTWRIAFALYGDARLARDACLLLGLATFFSGYVFAVWPHMTTLAFTLGGAWLCLMIEKKEGAHRLFMAAAAGAAFGAGFLVRLDAIFPAAAAFVWLRLFALPKDRMSALALIAGMTPFLFVAAGLNHMKFGVFNPFSYGLKTGGADSMEAYAALSAAAIALFTAMIFVDVTGNMAQRIRKAPMPAALMAGAAICLLISVLFIGSIWPLLRNSWLLIVDIQSYPNTIERHGIFKDEYGYWSFWELPKKALLQSLPFAALMVFAFVDLAKIRHVKAHSFSLLVIGAVLGFFCLKAFHGGMGYNMRYFLPSAPFIAILSAQALSRLRPSMATKPDLIRHSMIAGFAGGMLCYINLPSSMPAIETPLMLYPQLLMFVLLLTSLGIYLFRNTSRRGAAAVSLSGIAIGYACLLSTADALGYATSKNLKTPYGHAYASMIPPGSLILTTAEDYLYYASLHGIEVVRLSEETPESNLLAIDAYHTAGRCVFVHSRKAAIYVASRELERLPAPIFSAEDAENPGFELYGLKGQPAQCSLALH